MRRRHGWFLVVAILALLVAACGPQQATAPTAVDEQTPEATVAPTAEESSPTSPPESPPTGDYPVDEDDWHVLGEPDAPVTMMEFSDFQ